MKKVNYGIHLYININNLNSVVKKDENNHDNLCRTFHALNTFTAIIEKFANEFDNIAIEKFTTSRLHIYIPVNITADKIIEETIELVAFAQKLADFINKSSKYQSLVNFQIGCGADYGKYTEFEFTDKDTNLTEMTTIGSPANRAAKLQSLCDNGKVLISKEVYELLPQKYKTLFFGDHTATLKLARKYYDLSAYGATINDLTKQLDNKFTERASRNLDDAATLINNLNLGDMSISEICNKLDFSNLSLKNSKRIEEAAILFADIRGFTKKVDESNLSEMKQLVQVVLTMMYHEVLERDGVHVQFQGDRESAVFNKYKNETYDFAIRCILCAMHMLDRVDDINQNRTDKLNIGIGCSLGNIYAAKIGIRGQKFNLMMGQTVKEADDAEDNVAGVGIKSSETEIAITEELYKHLASLSGNIASKIKSTFSERETNGIKYYISTTRLSEIQTTTANKIVKENASKANHNNGIKPWGFWL